MKQNSIDNDISDEIKAYLKIKESNIPLDNPFIKVSSDNKIVTLNKSIFNQLPKEIQLKFAVDKVFRDKEEYSYIYEDTTLNCISNALNGINTCFFSFGESNSEKHSLLFGTPDSYETITERGIFPRLIESLLSKDSISISYSLMCINSNRLMDLSYFLNKDLSSFTADDLITQSLEIKQSLIVNNITKIPLKSHKELNEMIKAFNTLYSYFYAVKLNSSSHFVYVIYLYDNNDHYLVSNITLCELASQDKLITKITDPNNATKQSIFNTKLIIDNVYSYECIKKSIKKLKLINNNNKGSNSSGLDAQGKGTAKIMLVLHKLSFSSSSTKFIIIGCILHNVGMHEIAKDTLQFLFDCKKICEEKRHLDDVQALAMEKSKDDLIFKLKARCFQLDAENKQKEDMLKSKNDLLQSTKDLYKKQIDKLKSLFGYEGDVNVLIGGTDSSREISKIQSIRDAVKGLCSTKKQNAELIKKINDLKNKVDLLHNENQTIINDQSMLYYVKTAKEKNQTELLKLKITLDNAQEIIRLRELNDKLTQVNEGLQKELQSQYELIKNLPKAFEVNKEHSKTKKELKDDIRARLEEKNKAKVKKYQVNYDRELKIMNKKYEGLLREKDIRISDIQNRHDELLKQYNRTKDSYSKEMVMLYEILQELISSLKIEFNWKANPQISVLNYNKCLVSKEKCIKLVEEAKVTLNRINIPETLRLIDIKQSSLTNYNNKCKTLHIEIEDKFNKDSNQSKGDDNSELVSELQKENKELKRRIADMIELVNRKADDDKICSCSTKTLLGDLKHKVNTKLETVMNENARKGMVINVHERIINRLNSENITMKDMLNKKMITEKVNHPLPSAYKKAISNSSILFKSKSTRDIVTAFSYVKPNKLKDSLNESKRQFSS